MGKKKKVIILYRVVQGWRAPIFEKVAAKEDIDLEVWHGPDFIGTKVVSTKKDYAFKKTKMVSLKVKLTSKNGIIAMPFSPFLIFKLIYNNPDIIVTEGASNLFNALQAFVYSKIFKKKFIWWSLGKVQGRKYDKKRRIIDGLVKYIEKNSNAIIAYSSIGKDYFESLGINGGKIFKAVNVVDTDAIFTNLNQVHDRYELSHYRDKYTFINLFVGALTKEKSIELLLKAHAELEKLYPKCGLLIVGDGPYKKTLEELSRDLELNNVEFVGKVIEGNYKYFSIADLFTLPGLGGLAISEAMCYSLPVIASIGDGCEVDLLSNENGIIDTKMTSQSLFKYIEFFILNKEDRVRMGKHSLEVVKNKFNTMNYVNQVVSAINS